MKTLFLLWILFMFCNSARGQCPCLDAGGCSPCGPDCNYKCQPGLTGENCQYKNVAYGAEAIYGDKRLSDGKYNTCLRSSGFRIMFTTTVSVDTIRYHLTNEGKLPCLSVRFDDRSRYISSRDANVTVANFGNLMTMIFPVQTNISYIEVKVRRYFESCELELSNSVPFILNNTTDTPIQREVSTCPDVNNTQHQPTIAPRNPIGIISGFAGAIIMLLLIAVAVLFLCRVGRLKWNKGTDNERAAEELHENINGGQRNARDVDENNYDAVDDVNNAEYNGVDDVNNAEYNGVDDVNNERDAQPQGARNRPNNYELMDRKEPDKEYYESIAVNHYENST